jgi:hypothetical protein
MLKRTNKKMRHMLDSSILITMEDKLFNTNHAKMSNLIDTRMAITYSTLNRERKDEEELYFVQKEMENLHHLEKYYQDSTQVMVFLRSEFQYAYNKFTNERHFFITGIAEFQEVTLMVLVTCKDVEIWYEKAHQEVERIDYINMVQKGRYIEENHIRVLMDNNIDQIRKADKYWVKMAQEPQWEIQEKWIDCERSWVNINREMKNISLPKLGSPEDFFDFHDIVKQHG